LGKVFNSPDATHIYLFHDSGTQKLILAAEEEYLMTAELVAEKLARAATKAD
jgi:hypothetical protein